ncbi:MAG: MvaI/BcnI family restriction endonuclease [Syntrophales bacterium]
MPPLKLVKPTQPRSGEAIFRKVAEILKTGTWVFPDEGKYNGSGGPGRLLEDILGIKVNNADSPDIGGWEIKFHSGQSLLTLFHKDPEPRGIIRLMVHEHGWDDGKGRISFRHTIKGETDRGFRVVNENDRLVIRNRFKDTAVPHWTHNTLFNAFSSKCRRLIVIEGTVLKNPRRVAYQSATAYWEPDITGFSKAVADGVFYVDFDARTQQGAGSAIRNHGTKFRIKTDDLPEVYANKKKITIGLG